MVNSSEISEESSDWEVILNQYSHGPSSPPPLQGRLHDFELRDNYYDDESSVFPQSEHEDMPLLEEDGKSLRINSPSSSSHSEIGSPKEQQTKSNTVLPVMMNGIGSRMYTFGRRVIQDFICRSSKRYTSIISGTAIVVVLFACMKILQWRNRLLLLLREKDQRISQLLHQIAHMNEILSARRKVPVLRIN